MHHAWGTVDADIDGTPCTGTFAWTYFGNPAETGGSISMRCDDGPSLGAGLIVITIDRPDRGVGRWRFTVRLDDGFYVTV